MAPPARALDGPSGARLAERLATFDAYAETSRQRWQVPGLAVAVVQGDRVVWSFELGPGGQPVGLRFFRTFHDVADGRFARFPDK